jgi:LAGLIDADG endonuclease
LASVGYKSNLTKLHKEVSTFKTRLILNRTEKCVVKHTLYKTRFISSYISTTSGVAGGGTALAAGTIQEANTLLNPWFITGFTDAEGSFGANFRRSTALSLGMRFQPVMAIQLHKKDIDLLNKIRGYFGNVGFITIGEKLASFRVQSLKEITANIIPHFDKYPLITQKQADYLLFREIVMLMKGKKHLSKEGLQSIVNIKASLNLGLSEDLKVSFPETKPVARPVISDQKISNPEWIAGFTSGDGSFSVSIYNDPTRKLGVRISVRFIITPRRGGDESLMENFVKYFDCGSYKSRATREWGEFVVSNLSDIIEKIVPFFQKYKVRGIKSLDFQDWCQIVELMKDGGRGGLSQKKLDRIIKIKSGINKGRN